RAPPLGPFLSPTSEAEFRRWFAERKPISRLAAAWHRLLVLTVGRIVWSGKSDRVLRRLGGSWPPFPARCWHLRVLMRENAFLFNWAVERQLAYYRQRLTAAVKPKGHGIRGGTTMADPASTEQIRLPAPFAPTGQAAALRLAPKVTLRRL